MAAPTAEVAAMLQAMLDQVAAGNASMVDFVNLLTAAIPQGDLPGAGPPYVQSLTFTAAASGTTPEDMTLQWGGRLDFLFCAVAASTAYSSGITIDGTAFFLHQGAQPVPPATGLPFGTNGFKVKWPIRQNAVITATVVNTAATPVECTIWALVYRDGDAC